jgi:hypothetical protein
VARERKKRDIPQGLEVKSSILSYNLFGYIKKVIKISRSGQGISTNLANKAGKPVITNLFISDLPTGLIHRQYLFNLSVGTKPPADETAYS